MRVSVFQFLVAIAFVASCLKFAHAESATQTQDRVSTSRHLKITENAVKKDEDSISAEDEERAMFYRIKSLFRKRPTVPKAAKLDKRGAMEALTKLKSIVGLGTKPTKLTPTKAKALEAYARENPHKWEAMAYYLDDVFNLTLMLFLLGGVMYLGLRYGF